MDGERRQICTGFGWENLKGKERLRHLGVDWRIILKLVWLGIGTSGAGVVDALMQVAV
jgi:hypothetical protein